MPSLYIDGDSNTAEQYVFGAQNWTTMVGAALGATVTNLAVSGRYAAGVFANVPAIVAAEPDRCLILIGTNDMAHAVETGTNTPQAASCAAYLATMAEIIDDLQDAAIPVAIISPPFSFASRPVTIDTLTYVGASAGARETARWPAWIQGLAELCVDRECDFLDLWTAMATVAETATAAQFEALYQVPALDGYHLSVAGHAFVANFVIAQMQGLNTVTITPDPATSDFIEIDALAGALTLANPISTTPRKFIARITDNGTARAITYGTQYRGTLPTTTHVGKTLYQIFLWNAALTTWDLVGTAELP